MDDIFDDGLPGDELFPDEHELKKEIKRLNRQLTKFREEQAKDINKLIKQHERALINTSVLHESQLEHLREQIRELFEKNHELHETSKLFLKGLEHLKQEGIKITTTHHWNRKGVHGSLAERVKQLTLDKRIVSICPLHVSPQGDVLEALIVTEHIDKMRKA